MTLRLCASTPRLHTGGTGEMDASLSANGPAAGTRIIATAAPGTLVTADTSYSHLRRSSFSNINFCITL